MGLVFRDNSSIPTMENATTVLNTELTSNNTGLNISAGSVNATNYIDPTTTTTTTTVPATTILTTLPGTTPTADAFTSSSLSTTGNEPSTIASTLFVSTTPTPTAATSPPVTATSSNTTVSTTIVNTSPTLSGATSPPVTATLPTNDTTTTSITKTSPQQNTTSQVQTTVSGTISTTLLPAPSTITSSGTPVQTTPIPTTKPVTTQPIVTTPTTVAPTTVLPTDPPTGNERAVSISFRLLDTFTSDLEDRNSARFKQLAQVLIIQVNIVCRRIYGFLFLRSYVITFRSGSVLPEMGLVFRDNSSTPTIENATTVLNSELTSNNTGLNISAGSVNATNYIDPTTTTTTTTVPATTILTTLPGTTPTAGAFTSSAFSTTGNEPSTIASTLFVSTTSTPTAATSPPVTATSSNTTVSTPIVNTSPTLSSATSPPVTATPSPNNTTSTTITKTSPQQNTTFQVQTTVSGTISTILSPAPTTIATSGTPVQTTPIPTTKPVTTQPDVTTPTTVAPTTVLPTDPPTGNERALSISFRLLDTFTSDLGDRNSARFKQLAQVVIIQVNIVCRRIYGFLFLRSYVIAFRSGSVLPEMGLVFRDNSSIPTLANATTVLNTELTSNNTGLNISAGSVNATSYIDPATTTTTTTIPATTISTTVPATTPTTAPSTITTSGTPVQTTPIPTTKPVTTKPDVTTPTTVATTTVLPTDPPTGNERALSISFRLLDTFTSDLGDRNSARFKQLAQVVIIQVNIVCRRVYGFLFLRSYVIAFRSGSVLPEMGLVFRDNSSIPTLANATTVLNTELTSNNTGLNISAGSVNATNYIAPTTTTTVPATTNSTTVPAATNSTTLSATTNTSATTASSTTSTTATTPATDPPTSTEGTLRLRFSLVRAFKADYGNKDSAAYKALALEVITEINRIGKLLNPSAFKRFIINSFTSGSTVTDGYLIYSKNLVPDAATTSRLFETQLQSSSLDFIKGTASVESTTTSSSPPQPTMGTLAFFSLTVLAVAQMLVSI